MAMNVVLVLVLLFFFGLLLWDFQVLRLFHFATDRGGSSSAGPHVQRRSVPASYDTGRTEMKCAFPGPTATRCCSCYSNFSRSCCSGEKVRAMLLDVFEYSVFIAIWLRETFLSRKTLSLKSPTSVWRETSSTPTTTEKQLTWVFHLLNDPLGLSWSLYSSNNSTQHTVYTGQWSQVSVWENQWTVRFPCHNADASAFCWLCVNIIVIGISNPLIANQINECLRSNVIIYKEIIVSTNGTEKLCSICIRCWS